MKTKVTSKLKPETKVGLLVVGTLFVTSVLAWVLGLSNPFQRSVSFYVTYRFAGGIEVGSPVRVSGIKVGKVEKIEFFVANKKKKSFLSFSEPGSATEVADHQAGGADSPDAHAPDAEVITPLKVKISIAREAMAGVRQDSRFYINLAGIIGERYIEVTPGTYGATAIQGGDIVPGVDPPRIDQLLSQSFDLAGKITDIIEKNKGDFTKSLDLLYKLSGNLNKTLEWVDRSKVFKTDLSKLIDNLIGVTSDLRKVTSKVNTPEGEKTLTLLYDLLWRLEPLDSKKVREFMQKEGIRVQFF